MGDFAVSLSGLRSTSANFGDTGTRIEAINSNVKAPEPIMFGIFLAPLMSAVLPPLDSATRQINSGVSHAHQVVGDQLKSTADAYEKTEGEAVKLALSLLEEL